MTHSNTQNDIQNSDSLKSLNMMPFKTVTLLNVTQHNDIHQYNGNTVEQHDLKTQTIV
jgi:hypothetical protein